MGTSSKLIVVVVVAVVVIVVVVVVVMVCGQKTLNPLFSLFKEKKKEKKRKNKNKKQTTTATHALDGQMDGRTQLPRQMRVLFKQVQKDNDASSTPLGIYLIGIS